MDNIQEQGDGPHPGTVAVVHFFSERTDGVSLQIQENDRVLSQRGWNVIECSADATGANGFVLPELDYSTPQEVERLTACADKVNRFRRKFLLLCHD